MVTVQRNDWVCEKCGYEEGLYQLNCRTNEEWFVCELCGWGYETQCRRFGQDSLSELRSSTKNREWHSAWPVVDPILRSLLDECKQHRNDENYDVLKIGKLLERDASERTHSDIEYVTRLAEYRSLFATENGEVIFDYTEKAPKLMTIPLSELRPMSELDEFLRREDGKTEIR